MTKRLMEMILAAQNSYVLVHEINLQYFRSKEILYFTGFWCITVLCCLLIFTVKLDPVQS